MHIPTAAASVNLKDKGSYEVETSRLRGLTTASRASSAMIGRRSTISSPKTAARIPLCRASSTPATSFSTDVSNFIQGPSQSVNFTAAGGTGRFKGVTGDGSGSITCDRDGTYSAFLDGNLLT